MKKSKKILTIALSFALLTVGVQSYNTSKADSYNVPTIAQITSEVKKKVYNVRDEEILKAIKYHTTGNENMSLLEKIVFLADAIEEKRSYLGVVGTSTGGISAPAS